MKTTSDTDAAVISTPANNEVDVASPAAANTEEVYRLRAYLEAAYQHQARTLEVLEKALAITRRRPRRDRRDVDMVI